MNNMLEFIFGIVIGFFLTLVGIAIGAAAGPSNEFDDMYEDIKDESIKDESIKDESIKDE